MSGPLEGVRGVVLTQAWAGSYCTELLAMAWADGASVDGATGSFGGAGTL